VFSAERKVFLARIELHSAFAAVNDLSKQPLSRERAALSRWTLRIDCSVTVLGFLRGHVTPLIGIVNDWFTSANQTKSIDRMTGDLDNEL
jgi:hypothetical protein